ncbi:hypothetical protein Tco_0908518 [Tanacetum coccineum]|uniref:Uncharacterized protein n=1 Tax=Tanacetum coccineum TaxID=301880 RepID=A0ABQ5CQM6_9ASTR
MECSSCGALYNKSCGCSKGGLVDKFVRDPNKTPDSSQRPPQDCVKCGNPVEGPNCQGCALWRKKLKEVWFTICHENGIYQDLLNTYESSDDDTNVVNAPQEPFVSCGNGAHIGYNCPPKVLIISNPEPCNNQTDDELPQNLPSFDPTCYSGDGSSFTYDSTPNFVNDSPNIPVCYDDDDDEESSIPLKDIIIYGLPRCVAITPDSPKTDSLIMVDKHLDTILKTESDEFIKSSVENLVQNPSESEDECECDVPDYDDSQTTNFSTYSNPLFDDSTSSDDESSHEEEIHEMSFITYLNPFFDLDEILMKKSLPLRLIKLMMKC